MVQLSAALLEVNRLSLCPVALGCLWPNFTDHESKTEKLSN